MKLHDVVVWDTDQLQRAMGVIQRHAALGVFGGKQYKTFMHCRRLYVVRVA